MNKLELLQDEIDRIFYPHKVYAVGGCVRDSLLGREPKDFDYCTSLSPDDIEKLVKKDGRHAYLIGKKFGTIGFKILLSGKPHYTEVTTFRQEVYTPGSRKPIVDFVSDINDDLNRRDFTINSIAWDGDYYDPKGGRLDILAKKIKAVGEATDRFKDDPLRMLRAARFAAQLDFEVDANMIGKIRKMADRIMEISRERWVQELDKLLVQDSFEAGLKVLSDSYLMKYMLPEIWLLSRTPAGWELLVNAIGSAPPKADDCWVALLSVSAAGFFYNGDINDENYGKFKGHEAVAPEIARGIGLRLKFSNDRMKLIATRLGDKLNKS